MFAVDNVEVNGKIGTGKKTWRSHKAMTSDENTTHSLCTFPVTKAKEAMKMEHCLSLGQMTQNNHRRDDNAYTVKMLLTRKKKKGKEKEQSQAS